MNPRKVLFEPVFVSDLINRSGWSYSTPHFRFDQELFKGNTISSPGGSIVCLVSPKKSYKLNSLGKNYFFPQRPRPFSLLAKNVTGGHNA